MKGGRKNNTILRLKIAWHFAKGDFMKHMQTMTCGLCGSVDISPLSEPIMGNVDKVISWSATWQCDKCGATCNEIQLWSNI